MKQVLYCLMFILMHCCINAQTYHIREGSINDTLAIFTLWQAVTMKSDGLAAMGPDEVKQEKVATIVETAVKSKSIFIAEDENKNLIGAIWGQKYGLRSFAHCLFNAHFFVHPEYQDKGVGKKLMQYALDYIKQSRPEILRVEFGVNESNQRAIHLYSELGCVIEGRQEQKIAKSDGSLEATLLMVWFNPNWKPCKS